MNLCSLSAPVFERLSSTSSTSICSMMLLLFPRKLATATEKLCRRNGAADDTTLQITLTHTHRRTNANTKSPAYAAPPLPEGTRPAAETLCTQPRGKTQGQTAGGGREEELRRHSVSSDALWPHRQRDATLSRGRVGEKHIYHEREGLLSVPPPVRGGGRLVAASQSSPPSS